jgi:magnesium-transporting ATPase (P-type)
MFGQLKEYKIMAVNAFNSKRKRMSVLVREVETGRYTLFAKGADTFMLPLSKFVGEVSYADVDQQLIDFSEVGLRTLVISSKEIEIQDAEEWLRLYETAASSLVDR